MAGGLFGPHVAGVIRWPGGRGSEWKWAATRRGLTQGPSKSKECLHGRYGVGVGVGNHSPCIFDGRRSDGPRTVLSTVLFSAR